MPARVLVADDEPAITNIAAQVLGAAGFEVLQAHDGGHALTLAREERPDVVLLDVMMPGMDGVEVLRRIRAEPELHGTPVALFSSLPETQIDWRTAGADAFLQKVFNVLELPDFVRGLLDRRGGGNGRDAGEGGAGG